MLSYRLPCYGDQYYGDPPENEFFAILPTIALKDNKLPIFNTL
jgi:hypothetical protein